MKELKIPALVENIEKVTEFVNEYLESLNCPLKIQMKIFLEKQKRLALLNFNMYL